MKNSGFQTFDQEEMETVRMNTEIVRRFLDAQSVSLMPNFNG